MFAPWIFALCFAQPQDVEEWKKEVRQLRQELDEMKKKRQEGVSEQDLEKLEGRLEKRLKEMEQRLEAVSRAAAATAFNPKITAFINAAARVDDRRVFVDPMDPDSARQDDNGYLRGAELDFRAPVDPYAEGILILAIEGGPEEGFEAEVEEGYALIKRLPVVESAPLGLKIKAGKFRTPFGVSNRLHLHDMPHITRPLVVARFLGSESGEFFEAGHSPVGVECEFLPVPVEFPVLTVFADIVQPGHTAISEDNAPPQPPAALLHLDLFFPFHPEHKLNIGASGHWESGGFPASLFGIDWTYTWRPLEAGRNRSIVVGGEFFWARRAFDDSGSRERNSPCGMYVYVQGQISQPLYLGVRYDWVQDIVDRSIETRAVSFFVTFYTSEFLRLRAGYEHRESDNPFEDGVDTVMVELNIVFGSHPVEPYWVNR
jgi:ElaB/YqjD/DUF883 family membrane-anchored ribosome-binding protein